jgi:LPS-assembly protein
VSTELSWRRTIIDDVGQVWTPFTYVRADGFFNDPNGTRYENAQIANFIDPRADLVGRAMPAIGLEYRYPFIADAGRYGTHTLTPIGQVIARPNESRIGRLPNEDAHSLVYDDTTLFEWDKFSGYDRVEGGVRANVGLKYNIATPAGWTGNAVFGQSYQLAGRNSYAVGDLLNTGIDSGLDSRASDFVARLQLNPSDNFSFIARTRLNKSDLSTDSFEAQMVANFKPLLPMSGSLTYARYGAQPAIGFPNRREGLSPAASFQLSPNWSVGGSVVFDLDSYLDRRDAFASQYIANLAAGGQNAANWTFRGSRDRFTIAQSGLSLGYKDECTTFSINYA